MEHEQACFFAKRLKQQQQQQQRSQTRNGKKALVLDYFLIVQIYFFTIFQSSKQHNLLEPVIKLITLLNRLVGFCVTRPITHNSCIRI